MLTNALDNNLVQKAKMSMSGRKCETTLKEIEDEKKLVEAAKSGDNEEAKRLLEAGVSSDSCEFNKQRFYQSENYMTPLQYATQSGFPKIVKLLIEHGADVDSGDRFDVTALHIAAEFGHEECMKLLLEGGADCNVSTKYSKHGSYTAVPHPGGTTPLHLAALNNHIGCVRILIWNGADYNAVDERGRTSLYIAAQIKFGSCVHAHLDNAIWKDILSLPEKYCGDTPLHECVKNNMLDCVSKLLNHGSDVNHLNNLGVSPLHMAVRAGEHFNMDILRELIRNGYNTDINLPENIHNYTPLHFVCFNDVSHHERRPEAAVLLLAYGANYNIRNKAGDTVIQSELRSRSRDITILSAIAKCTASLPSLDSMGLGMIHSNSNPVNIQPAQQQQLQQQRVHHDHFLARLFSDNQYSKFTWYKDLFKEPRTLQHYCRCTIRDRMGPSRLRKLDSLPLPTTLKEYLLLEHDEFRRVTETMHNQPVQ